jgi:hypothetical protein
MVTDRLIVEADLPVLQSSLETSQFHKDTKIEFFTDPKIVSKVYEDETSPILILRCAKSLRLDIEFLNDNDIQRNREAMITGLPKLIEQAKHSGYTELVFNSSNPLLTKFANKKLGFTVVTDSVLRKDI